MIIKARKKPVEIEALQWNGYNYGAISKFLGENLVDSNENLYIRTLEGDMLLTEGDFIIKGIEGEFYPCKENIFYQTYDIV